MRFIIIDGLDGVGKDTQAQFIKKRYDSTGEKVIIRSHPESDNIFGRKAKKALFGRGKIDKTKAAVFYMMDVLRSIKKYYGKKDIDTIIMVRYLIGTAYLPKKLAKVAYRFFYNFVPTSKYMFFLDAPPKEIIKRYKNRDKKEMFENYKELKKVRKKALFLVKDWQIINSAGTINDVSNKITEILDFLDKEN